MTFTIFIPLWAIWLVGVALALVILALAVVGVFAIVIIKRPPVFFK